MSGFHVDADRLRQRATTIAGVADRLAGAAGRVPDGVPEGALGSFTRFLAAGLSGAVERSGAAIGGASEAVDAIGAAVRRSAEDYQRADDDSADRLTGGTR
ncbi:MULTISPECIES: type VII secretion target [Actinosynnema]|uniref:type VII secretion target n=1 Tax=Actinosynnema TaxID=40566 RepID=UPI0020A581F2|nr:type VII secretion target [Actinosynnema pretiosum]MCP2096216.1 Excreted virulence factor EspC, type VII ESX diderm [Actinosynnema pretiosum]